MDDQFIVLEGYSGIAYGPFPSEDAARAWLNIRHGEYTTWPLRQP